MDIFIDRTGTIQGFKNVIDQALLVKGVKSLLILSCDKNDFPLNDINNIITELSIPIFGGIFPAIIYETDELDKGTVAVGISREPVIHVIPGLSDLTLDYEEIIDNTVPNIDFVKTMLVFVDGMSKRIVTFLECLFNVFGVTFNYFGGGAGSLTLKQKPCLFTNQGMLEDSALLVLTDFESGVGIKRGMKSISEPLQITEVKEYTIKTLNWRPALQEYRNAIEEHIGKLVPDKEFYGIHKNFSLGIVRFDAEKIVREPLNLEQTDEIAFACEMREGEFVDVLEGTIDSTITSAKDSSIMAKDTYKALTPYQTTLCFNCTARRLFLGDRYKDELSAIKNDNRPLIGACTIGGEIANNGKDYLEYLNRTCVVAKFEG